MSKGVVYTTDNINSNMSGAEKVAHNIKNVLLTKVGTRPNLPNFGSKLSNLEYYPMDQILIDLASLYIREAIANSLDGIIVSSIKTTINKIERSVSFQIIFVMQNGVNSALSLNYNGEKFS